MPFYHDPLPAARGPRVAVRASVASELEWALAAAERADFRDDHATLAAAYDADPALHERVCSLWGPGEATSCGGFLELLVLAHHGGLLFSTDPAALLGRLEDLCADAPVGSDGPPLRSETEADRLAVLRRLRRLRSSRQRRGDYVAVVSDVWAAVGGDWERFGRRAADVAVSSRLDALTRGSDWRDIARTDCGNDALLAEMVAALPPEGEVVVIPAFFTHRGMLVDLPGLVLVGVRTDNAGAHARTRTESLARRLKAISDPTRLAILDMLRSGPRTVTEIATTFALAQPTVSNHVKLLRDAGLLTDAREGTRRNLVLHDRAVDDLLASLREVLSSPAS